jgi:hypothetical protein
VASEQFALDGPLLGRRFTIKFKAEPHLAARRARKASLALRTVDGTWREFTVATPAGEATRIFISEDKSAKTTQLEMATKRLHKAISEYSTAKAHMVKKDGVVTIDWVPIAKVEVSSGEPAQVLWHPQAIEKHNIDKEKVLERFAALAGGASARHAIQWCL